MKGNKCERVAEAYYWAPCNWKVHLLIKAWTKYTTLLLIFKIAVPRVIRYNGIYQGGDRVIKKPEGLRARKLGCLRASDRDTGKAPI